MKRVLVAVIFILASLFTFVALFMSVQNSYRYELETMGENDFAQTICFTALGEPEELYAKVTEVLDRHRANLYVARVYEQDGRSVYVKYVYVSQPAAFQDISLAEGRFLRSTDRESDVYLSTDPAENDKRIGRIDCYPAQDVFEIRTLKSGWDMALFNHVFVLQALHEGDVAAIADDWAEAGILITKMPGRQGDDVDFGMIYALVVSCLVVFSLVMFHDILRSHRRIAVEKMNGFSAFAVWKDKALPLLRVLGSCSAGVMLLGVFWLLGSWSRLAGGFLVKMALIQSGMLVLAAVFLTLPFLYIRYINITEVLRRRKETWPVIIFSFSIKAMATTVLVIYGSVVLSHMETLWSQHNTGSAQWRQAAGYYTMTAALVQEDDDEQRRRHEEGAHGREIYKYFNNQGALYADFDMFASYNEAQDSLFLRKAVVNPNYLKKHAVYDNKDKRIYIDETRDDMVLLVPEAYRDREREIREYYQRQRADGVAELSLLWLRDDQAVFTYRFDMNPENGNCVKDAILQVLTEKNGDDEAYKAVTGYKGNPLKICAKSLDDVQKKAEAQFSIYDDGPEYRFSVTDVYDAAEEQLRGLRSRILFDTAVMAVLLVVIGLLFVQNIMGYISENRSRIALQHTLGFRTLDKILRYFVLVLLTWGFILSGAMLFDFGGRTALLCGGVIVFETVCAFVIFAVIERKNAVRIMKGG